MLGVVRVGSVCVRWGKGGAKKVGDGERWAFKLSEVFRTKGEGEKWA